MADAVEAEVIVEGEGKEMEGQADEDEGTASEGSRRPIARGGGGGATTVDTAADARGAAMDGARNELDAAVAAPVGTAM